MAEDTTEKTKEELSPEAKAIIDNLAKKIEETKNPPKDVKETPKSEPSKDQYQAWREDTKKKMNWNDEQLNFHESSVRQAQAPLMKESAVLSLKTTQKDFDALEKPFMAEIENYEKNLGRIIDKKLAEDIFHLVKGRELSAGRYTPPTSQPARGANPGGSRTPTSRIAPSYNPADAGMGGGGEGDEGDENRLSDEEKQYAKIAGVDEKSYAAMRSEKKAGKRELADRSWKAPEIDVRSAGPADRDLAGLWSKNGNRV
jgi:hypothetical protein